MLRFITIGAILLVVWVVAIPLAFVTLYSALELQAAARAAKADSKGPRGDNDPRLTTLQTIELANDWVRAGDALNQKRTLEEVRQYDILRVMAARRDVRSKAIDFLSSHGVDTSTTTCTAPLDVLNKCQIEQDLRVCLTDWKIIADCYRLSKKISSGNESDAQSIKDLTGSMSAASSAAEKLNITASRIRSIKSPLPSDSVFNSNPLLPVSKSYNSIHFPLFRTIFAMPQGVIVACFTSIMAVLGAGVGSLSKFIRRIKAPPENPEYYIHEFLATPILGGLAGFMVYFVVSAGTAFLVQTSAGSATEAVNNLSVPALASLGVFAGLSAEQAIVWLQSKANAFFKTDSTNPPS